VYLSYDYIRVYSKYGYYITGVKPVPTLTVPPYNQLILQTRVPLQALPPSKVPPLLQKVPSNLPTKTLPMQKAQ
jgi:hypothetical protein